MTWGKFTLTDTSLKNRAPRWLQLSKHINFIFAVSSATLTFEFWISGCVTSCSRVLTLIHRTGRGNMLAADRMSLGQDNRATLHYLASSWTHWHMIDSDWWEGASHWSFHQTKKKRGSTLLVLSGLFIWFSRLTTYFGNLQNMLPPERLGFYLWPVQGNALPKFLATIILLSLL